MAASILSGWCAAALASGRAPNAERAEARALYEAGEFEKAKPLFERLAARLPDDGVVKHQLGVCREMTGDREGGRQQRLSAIPQLRRQAQSAAPPVAVLYYLVGDLDVAKEQAEAAKVLDRAVALWTAKKLVARSPSETYQMAALLEKAGKVAESEALLKEALAGLKAAPRPNRRYLSDTLVRLGNHDVERKDMEAAMTKFRDAQLADPANPGAYYAHGVMLDSQGQLDEARKQYEKVLALDPSYFYAQYNLANLMGRQGALKEAIEGFEKAIALEPSGDDLARAYVAAAKACEAAAEHSKAADLYERLGRIRPDPEIELSARYARAHALVKEGKLDEGIRALRDVSGKAPDVAPLRAEIASLLMRKKDYAAAAKELMAALALAPEVGALYLALGRAHAAQGRRADAEAAFRKARDLPGTKEEADRELAGLKTGAKKSAP